MKIHFQRQLMNFWSFAADFQGSFLPVSKLSDQNYIHFSFSFSMCISFELVSDFSRHHFVQNWKHELLVTYSAVCILTVSSSGN